MKGSRPVAREGKSPWQPEQREMFQPGIRYHNQSRRCTFSDGGRSVTNLALEAGGKVTEATKLLLLVLINGSCLLL